MNGISQGCQFGFYFVLGWFLAATQSGEPIFERLERQASKAYDALEPFITQGMPMLIAIVVFVLTAFFLLGVAGWVQEIKEYRRSK